MSKALVFNGIVLFWAVFGCLLSILEQQSFSYIFFILSYLALQTWCFQLGFFTRPLPMVAYCAVGIFISYALVYLNWIWYYAFVIWLCAYPHAVPDGDLLTLKVSKYHDEEPGGGPAQGPSQAEKSNYVRVRQDTPDSLKAP